MPEPGYRERVRESFSRQRVMATLGAELVRIDPGRVEIRLPVRDELTQQHGFVHAGVISTIADSACGYAAYTLMPPDAAVLSVEYKINLLAPARGEHLLAKARVDRAGRTVSTCSAEVFAVENDTERLVAVMLGTMMTVLDPSRLNG